MRLRCAFASLAIEQPPPFEPPGEGSAMSVGALAMGPEPKSALVRQMH